MHCDSQLEQEPVADVFLTVLVAVLKKWNFTMQTAIQWKTTAQSLH